MKIKMKYEKLERSEQRLGAMSAKLPSLITTNFLPLLKHVRLDLSCFMLIILQGEQVRKIGKKLCVNINKVRG